MKDKILLLYQKYGRIILVPFLTIILFMMLVPFVIAPQIQLLLKTRQDLADGKLRLIKLDTKKANLRAFDESILRQEFSLASLALPSGKDVGSILVTLDLVSQRSGVVLGNFTTSVGSLDEASDAAKLQLSPKVGAPSLKMTISARGERNNIRQFLQALSQALPLVTVETISLSRTDATISLLFYYKPVFAVLPPVDSDLPSLARFQDTIASLSARSSQLILPETAPSEKVSTPTPQLRRQNPFF